MTTARRVPPPRLLAFTPGATTAPAPAEHEDLVRRIGAAVEGGLTGVVLREPLLPDGPYLALARRVRTLIDWLALHDRPHLVAEVGADAVHLGFRSLAPAEARALVGAQVGIGFSEHAGGRREARAGADYVTYGPVFETPSKVGLVAPVGVAGLREFCRVAEIPVFALGGVTAARGAECLAAGAHGLAALGALLGHPEPAAQARAFGAVLADAASSGAAHGGGPP